MRSALLLAFLASGALSAQQPPTAAEIVARVAANQDRAVEARTQFVYEQRVRVQTRRTNGKLLRDETAEYEAFPGPKGTEKRLKTIAGQFLKGRQYTEFKGEPVPEKDSIDGQIIDNVRDDILSGKSKDGVAGDLFPLTTEQQKKYRFELLGEQVVKGRKVWRIGFRPADRGDIDWAGEALIDEQEYQPLNIYTKLSRKIPFAIRTLLGTDLPGLGFNVNYQRFDEGVWFPVSFGSEFRLHILFFLNRQINASLENTGFRRTRVDTTVKFADPAASAPQTQSPPPPLSPPSPLSKPPLSSVPPSSVPPSSPPASSVPASSVVSSETSVN